MFSVQHNIVNHVEYTIGRTRYRFDDFEAYQARPGLCTHPFLPEPTRLPSSRSAQCSHALLRAFQAASYAVRDRLIESWNDTNQWYRQSDPKRVYYLSMEFLMVRHSPGNRAL